METRNIYINDLKIHYKIAGKGQPILILHGWGSSSNSWVRVQEILAQNNFQVIVPDLPGFGKSDLPKTPWNIDAYVNFVKTFCDKMRLNSFNLIGHSFGGRVSIKILIQHPDKIKNLILVDSAGIKPDLHIKDKTILTLARIMKLLSKIKLLVPFINKIKKFSYRTILRKRDYAKLNGVMKETFKNVIDENLLPYISKIKVRTLLIWGEKDKSVPIRYAYIFKNKISNSELKIIPNVGHCPNLYVPKKLSQLITNFLT